MKTRKSHHQERTPIISQEGHPEGIPHADVFPDLSDIDRDQAFIDYLDELDGPIYDNELVEWSDDIDLFMEGLSNPDKLEELWEQSKAKKQWDESQSTSPSRLDRHQAITHPPNDTIPTEDCMGRWCNVIHQPLDAQPPLSPTPVPDERMPPLFSPEELENLDKYNSFMRDLSVRVEGGWFPLDTLPYNELRVAPNRIGSNTDFYPDSEWNQGVQTLRK